VSTTPLRQPRDVGTLFRDSLTVYFRHSLLFILLSAAVVVPVQLIVEGIGLERLTSSYDSSPSPAEAAIPFIVEFVVMIPIISAICIYALQAIAAGERPSPGQVFVSGFEAFTPLFAAVLLAALGIAAGLLILIVPGIYLAVRWYFVPQAVVIEGARGADPLVRSGQLVQGFWWRTFGLVVLANLAVAVPVFLLLIPFTALAESTDRALWGLVGSMLVTSLTTPFLALYSTFLYYDLLARRF
jgi:hypothetical protein